MTRYRQLTSGERYALSALRKQGCNQAAIARTLGRHRSTISREVRRNSKDRAGRVYRPDLADDYARWRRGRSRRNERFRPWDWRRVEACLRQQWSPEQTAGWLRRKAQLSISHETIYRYVWRDRKQGGSLYLHLRCSPKQRRNGTDPTIPEVGWPANVPSVNDPLVLSIEAESATSKPIP